MKLDIKSLSVLLSLQIFLAAVLILTEQQRDREDEDRLTINLSIGNVSELTITDETSKVNLILSDDSWLVANETDFPADSVKVNRLLESIENLSTQPTNIVAVTKTARVRFKVDSEDFNKRIRLTDTKGISEELYLGSSPGLDLTHIRKHEEDAIHVTKFPAYQASGTTSSWLDKSILQINSQDLVYLEAGEIVLQRNDDKEMHTPPDGKLPQSAEQQSLSVSSDIWVTKREILDRPLSQDAAEELSKQIERLRFTELSNIPEVSQQTANVLTLLLQLKDGEKIKYTIRKDLDEDNYFLLASGWDQTFSIGSYTAERLIEAASEEVLFPEETSVAD